MEWPARMRTPDGIWTVDVLESRSGTRTFLVRHRELRGTSTSTRGVTVATIEQVSEIMGQDFDLLVDER